MYVVHCFLFPIRLCRSMKGLLNSFWWQNGRSKRGIHWSLWQKLCASKVERGLRFRDFASFNVALLAK